MAQRDVDVRDVLPEEMLERPPEAVPQDVAEQRRVNESKR
jgi:hypothetical protein